MKLLIICGLFLIIPFFVDQILMEKMISVMKRSEWFSFLGSYLGGGFGAMITLFGVYWQLNETKKREKRENLEGVLKYIKYFLVKNTEKKFPYKVLGQDKCYEIRKSLYFIELQENFIQENLKKIFSIKNGEGIIKIMEDITLYNNEFFEYKENYMLIEIRIKCIKETLSNFLVSSEIKDKYIDLIDCYKITIDSLYAYDTLFNFLVFKPNMNIMLNDENALNYFEEMSKTHLKQFVSKISSKNQDVIPLDNILNFFNIIKIDYKNVTLERYESYLDKFLHLEMQLINILRIAIIDKKIISNDLFSITKLLNEYFKDSEIKKKLLLEKNIILDRTKNILKEIDIMLIELEK